MNRRMTVAVSAVAAAALTIAACSAPNDVVVTSANQPSSAPNDASSSTSRATASTIPATVPTDTVPGTTPDTLPGTRPVELERDPGAELAPGGFVLTADDVPGWQHSGPREVGEEPTFVATDCDLMNTVWSVAGSGGMRSRGAHDGVAFRNTAADMGDEATAAAVLDAAEVVWKDCVEFAEENDTWWVEPLDMPTSTTRSAGLVMGSSSVPAWALGLWQVGSTVTVLEVEGDDLWTYLNPLFETLTARLEGTPAPLAPLTPLPSVTPLPATEDPVATIPVATTAPITPPPEPVPEPDFPPTSAGWTSHPLAYLAPHPDDIGDGWSYKYGAVSEAEPADESEAIEGCAAAPPPTLDGVEVEYEYGSDAEEFGLATRDLEFSIWTGSSDEIDQVFTSFVELADCDLSDEGFPDGLTLSSPEVTGADSTFALSAISTYGTNEVTIAIVGARAGDVMVMAYLGIVRSTEGGTVALLEPSELVAEVSDLVTEIIAGR